MDLSKLGVEGLSPTPAVLSLIIEKFGLSLQCLKIFKLVSKESGMVFFFGWTFTDFHTYHQKLDIILERQSVSKIKSYKIM